MEKEKNIIIMVKQNLKENIQMEKDGMELEKNIVDIIMKQYLMDNIYVEKDGTEKEKKKILKVNLKENI